MKSSLRSGIRRKNYRIDVRKLDRARKALGTRTETETIHRALDMAAAEAELAKALRELIIKGRGRIEDIDTER
jgi:DNA polymerase III epsilon subunit-like protein